MDVDSIKSIIEAQENEHLNQEKNDAQDHSQEWGWYLTFFSYSGGKELDETVQYTWGGPFV